MAVRARRGVIMLSRLLLSLRTIQLALAVSLAFAAPQSANAVYNANLDGLITSLSVYGDDDYIYFQLANQPTSHPTCNPGYFVISQNIPVNRRNQMLAVILAAKTSGLPLGVGYDGTGNCMHGFIQVHRVG
jgi:hypothetical protein